MDQLWKLHFSLKWKAENAGNIIFSPFKYFLAFYWKEEFNGLIKWGFHIRICIGSELLESLDMDLGSWSALWSGSKVKYLLLSRKCANFGEIKPWIRIHKYFKPWIRILIRLKWMRILSAGSNLWCLGHIMVARLANITPIQGYILRAYFCTLTNHMQLLMSCLSSCHRHSIQNRQICKK